MLQHSYLLLLVLTVSSVHSLLKNLLASECPELDSEISEEACLAKVCNSDLECGPSPNAMCCSNGCVSTCLEVQPPIAFDWIEDTSEFRAGTNHIYSYPETIIDQDGCHMTPEQSIRIKKLLENKHIRNCFCDLGGYYCHVL